MKIERANIVMPFGHDTVGTKVLDGTSFLGILEKAVATYDFASQRVPGQGFITLPREATQFVSSGIGRRSDKPEDYVARIHRGRVGLFLRREHAAPVEGVAVVVYTATAYLSDPDVAGDVAEVERIQTSNATHIVVAVLAFAGPKPPLGLFTFVRNLTGANKEALVWTADEIRAKAQEILAYEEAWAVVSD